MNLRESTLSQARITLLSLAATRYVTSIWDRLGEDFSSQWDAAVRAEATQSVADARLAAIVESRGYIQRALDEQGVTAPPALVLNEARILATTPDGRTVGGLLDNGIIQAKTAIKSGSDWQSALSKGRSFIANSVEDIVRQTASDYRAIDTIRRPKVGGYVRQLSVPSCRLCIALAGNFYKTNTGFSRHYKCDCIHVPVETAEAASPLLTDQRAYFNSLTEEQQNDIFGENDARAIRDGANITTVVNKRTRGLNKNERNLTIDNVYLVAGDNRDRAIQLLQESGYLAESGRIQLEYRNPDFRIDRRDLTDPEQLTSAERRAAFAASATR